MVSKKDSPKISLVMATFGQRELLAESINSIIDQSFTNWELLLIDDNAGKLNISPYVPDDSRIRIIENPENMGLTRSLITGVAEANGKYIFRQDDDDLSPPDRFQTQLDYLESNSHVYLCGAEVKLNIDARGNEIGTQLYPTDPDELGRKLPQQNLLVHSSIAFRNQGINYRSKFINSQDYDLYLRLIADGQQLVNVPGLTIKFRYLEDSISHRTRVQQQYFADKAREFYHQNIKFGSDTYGKWDVDSELVSVRVSESRQQDIGKIWFYHKTGELQSMRSSIRALGWRLLMHPKLIVLLISSYLS